jgi:hypothetical protein
MADKVFLNASQSQRLGRMLHAWESGRLNPLHDDLGDPLQGTVAAYIVHVAADMASMLVKTCSVYRVDDGLADGDTATLTDTGTTALVVNGTGTTLPAGNYLATREPFSGVYMVAGASECLDVVTDVACVNGNLVVTKEAIRKSLGVCP